MPCSTVAIEELFSGMQKLIQSVEPDNTEAINLTPQRYIRALQEIIRGYLEIPDLGKQFDFVESDDLVIIKDIPFFSLCEHHILPFFGKIHIGYLPSNKILGLSKFARLTEILSKRLQVQEKLGREICDTIQKSELSPKGVVVVIEAQHMCMIMRGAKSIGSTTITSSISGVFKRNSDLKSEFYKLIERRT